MLGVKKWLGRKAREWILGDFCEEVVDRFDEIVQLQLKAQKALESKPSPPWWLMHCDMFETSGLFDAEYYRSLHSEELNGLSPIFHYITKGHRMGYNPSPYFSSERYSRFYRLNRYCSRDVNPLDHYITHGIMKGLYAFPLSDVKREVFPASLDRVNYDARTDKILLAVHELSYTGVPMLSLNIVKLLNKHGYRAAIISPMGGPLEASCRRENVPLIIDADFFFDKEAVLRYKKDGYMLALFNCICVAASFLIADEVMPSLLWIHDNVGREYFMDSELKILESKRNVYATSFVTTAHVKTYAPNVGYLPYPVEDVSNGNHAVPEKRIRFGIVGRIDPRKGQDVAVKALKLLKAETLGEIELVIVGDSVLPEFEKSVRLFAEGLPVRFLPPRQEASEYHAVYEEFDVMLCSSRTDPMPLVVLDGMMHGCPLVLSDKVGQSAFVRDGENGFVFKSGSEKSLAEAIEKMVACKNDYTRISKASRHTFVENFCADKAIKELLAAVDSRIKE